MPQLLYDDGLDSWGCYNGPADPDETYTYNS